MSLKIGHLGLIMVILLFLVSSFSLFIGEAENSSGLESGILGSGIITLNSNLSGVDSSVQQFTDSVDENSEMSIKEEQQLEDRLSESSGLLNILSKNVFTRFLNSVNNQFSFAGNIIKYFAIFIAMLSSILLIRFIWGDGKI